jgi:DNA repair ATPase RecN
MRANKNLRNIIGSASSHIVAFNEATETKDSLSRYIESIDEAVVELEASAEQVRALLEEDDGDFIPQSLLSIMDRIDADIRDLKKRTAKIG